MIYIGIDTGVHTGIAIWDNRKRSLEMVKQMPIHRAMAVVQSYADMQKTGVGDKIIVRVEDPRQRTWYNPQIEMFARFKMKSSFHKTKRII